ncbi:NAD-dependent deacylase [Isachenkonia alkalipeptolytica]|uniref:protein acetyllysine N-acetyltransferase n=1 Tax=Isachenkonia alkalipeptolytica TaxID=2565777 RepID=A0AA44BDR8_9CLOT|nr:NAD-dependent deacylase [Isachenkonia alkalipeptolytica]NBG88198.1 NAD-dependent deacylase [Isachenkonia alkalipeptolytica]
MKNEVMELADLLKNSKHVVVLTGAGMDTESNIPDFRGKDGWWKNMDPRTVASIDTLQENYSLFHEFYSMRLKMLEGVKPHKGHFILAELESRGMIEGIATQNVAGLHAMAGSRRVYELHGNIRSIRCNNCHREAGLKNFLNKEKCNFCGGALRPGVVLFGEMLPNEAWDSAMSAIERSDLLVVIGTSLEVYPVNQLPMMTRGKTVLINNEDRGGSGMFDLKIIGKAREVLEELYDNLED